MLRVDVLKNRHILVIYVSEEGTSKFEGECNVLLFWNMHSKIAVSEHVGSPINQMCF